MWLLLRASRRRSDGRQRRQRELLNHRSGGQATDWGSLAVVIGFFVMAVLHGFAAFALISVVEASQAIEVEREGEIVVSSLFLAEVEYAELAARNGYTPDIGFAEEAQKLVEHDGGDAAAVEQRLRAAVAAAGSRWLIAREDAEPGLSELARAGPTGAILGSAMLLWWFAMVACQGEGLELDLQRRRHPMWEWLLSHPIGAGAAFLAEMLSPLSANPAYWTAPLYVGILYGAVHGPVGGLAAAVLVGVPVTVAAACLGKALEIGAILRLQVRSRGAVIGILSWFGYASMVSMFFGPTVMPRIARAVERWTYVEVEPSWSAVGLFLGLGPDGDFSFVRGALFCWVGSALVVAAAVIFSARSIRHGLSGAFAADTMPARPAKRAKFGRDPLFRKEYLWFVRDRSAIVQTILIPVTIAGFQLFNLRVILEHARDSWNYLAGVAIFFGTYFLWVLGPKSLTSEGSALWIALTWPRGLESVLKAKAWLWSMIASSLVIAVLLTACWIFPHDSWKIALVAAGWLVFSRSMAEKSVTLVTVVSESGEAQRVSAGRRWAAQLGMLSFAIGVCTEQWGLAIVGIVYSWITAAAMWENLRARLPYLYDPWSETLPPAPTLMHAMVAISILIECASIIMALILAIGGRDSLAVAQGVGFAVCAVGVSIGVSHFLSGRGVSPARIWCWREQDPEAAESWVHRYVAADRHEAGWLLCGIGGGVILALLAQGYLLAIGLVPSIGEMIHASELQMRSIPGMAVAYAVIAIAFAPFAEEYLFRGLVFRTLDRQWGGWKAVLGAAAFFAIYHPPLAWLPVFAVGAVNCLLFKRSGRLAPAVLLHMAYNAVITLGM
ncbi:MAG TPA: CPBP family intramembrane glutamic endopeptidase [Methylomirabilota bacterium]|nr:CPBP family intramembrane glutamic endopeptidase [Methylomirabilota bacterium]